MGKIFAIFDLWEHLTDVTVELCCISHFAICCAYMRVLRNSKLLTQQVHIVCACTWVVQVGFLPVLKNLWSPPPDNVLQIIFLYKYWPLKLLILSHSAFHCFIGFPVFTNVCVALIPSSAHYEWIRCSVLLIWCVCVSACTRLLLVVTHNILNAILLSWVERGMFMFVA